MTDPTESIGARLARLEPDAMGEMQDLICEPLLALRAAACGDLEAQRKLALSAWARAVALDEETGAPDWIVSIDSLETALVFARLAAVHGTEQDVVALANWLSIASDLDPETEPDRMAEAIGWIEREADAGSLDAARALNAFVDAASPEAVTGAKEYRERLAVHLPLDRDAAAVTGEDN